MRTSLLLSISISLCLVAACSRDGAAPAGDPANASAANADTSQPPGQEVIFTAPELEQMVAPIALYPDPLLAQVLMAATYPGDVLDAVRWSAGHPDSTGDAAVLEVQTQPWDPSVQALVAFPQALAVLGQDPRWVQRLGDAFLAQPDDVMEAVQRLRGKAAAAGNLATNDYMVVSSEPAPPQPASSGDAGDSAYTDVYEGDTIIIEPADPEVVYVPSYDSTVVYGGWGYPSYPPMYYPTPYYYPPGGALWAGLAFGTGIAIADSLWGDFDWNDNDIDIDVDRYNNINVNNIDRNGGDRWRHNANNRDGVPYRDRGNRDRNGQRLDGGENRDRLRGDEPGRADARDRGRDQSRDAARDSLARHGVDQPARNSTEARGAARDAAAERPGGRLDGPGNRGGDRSAHGTPGQRPGDRGNADRGGQRPEAGQRPGGGDRQTADRGGGQRPEAGQRPGGSRERSGSQRPPSHNNAFNGASNPDASRGHSSRGRESHGGSQRSGGGSRSGGAPAQRSAPPRGGGGGGRRR